MPFLFIENMGLVQFQKAVNVSRLFLDSCEIKSFIQL